MYPVSFVVGVVVVALFAIMAAMCYFTYLSLQAEQHRDAKNVTPVEG
ncbi:hypothetical protein [Halorubrum gandharaense]